MCKDGVKILEKRGGMVYHWFRVEVQYHTRCSFYMKSATHAPYEVIRAHPADAAITCPITDPDK